MWTHQDARMLAASLFGLSSEENLDAGCLSLPKKLVAGVGTRYFIRMKVRRPIVTSNMNGPCPTFWCDGYFLEAPGQIVVWCLSLIRWQNSETFQYGQCCSLPSFSLPRVLIRAFIAQAVTTNPTDSFLLANRANVSFLLRMITLSKPRFVFGFYDKSSSIGLRA